MALLGDMRRTPLGGFVYTQAETQTRMEHLDSLGHLVELVVQHRAYKGLPRANFDDALLDVQRQICEQMPPGVCKAEPGEDYRPKKDLTGTLTLDKITSFSFAIFEWLRSGHGFVDDEEATRRAKICLGCPLNKTIHACACAPLWVMLKAMIPPRRRIDNLHICGVCGCALQAAVLAPMNVIKASDEGRNLEYPSYCWKQT